MQWEDFDGDGYYVAEGFGASVLINTNDRRIDVFVSGPDLDEHDLSELHRLLGGLGLAFPGSGAELAYGIASGGLGAFTVGADRGVWTFTADF